MNSRRNFLKTVTGAGFGRGSTGGLSSSIRKALAIPANNATGTIKDVEHVVILMQENRSFDHYFGTLKGVRGFGDTHHHPAAQRSQCVAAAAYQWHRTDPLSPGRQREQRAARRWNADTPGWTARRPGTTGAWLAGRRRRQTPRWATSRKSEIPFQFALANAFTLCDAYHCSMHTGTDANRSFHMTGTNGAAARALPVVNNEWDWIDGLPSSANVGYTWKTYAERLEEAGINWISYQNMPDEWGDNMLGAFRPFRLANLASGYPGIQRRSTRRTYDHDRPGAAVPRLRRRNGQCRQPALQGRRQYAAGDRPEELPGCVQAGHPRGQATRR
ncbi:alkaline phosphatase family protein [Cupriavidus basilensis]